MRKKIIIGNWKMNKNWNETEEFFKNLNKAKLNLKDDMLWGIALPAINLELASKNRPNTFIVAAQDISKHEKGAFTGEISADMLKSINVDAVVIGHSERRTYHKESDQDINQKAKMALDSNILPIICVGETLEQYEKGLSKEVVKNQLSINLANIDAAKVVIAYEPIWAIGTGKTATIEYAQEMCAYIRSLTSDQTLIQYGGSVNANNVDEFLAQADIDGALVGGASLEVDSFLSLINKK